MSRIPPKTHATTTKANREAKQRDKHHINKDIQFSNEKSASAVLNGVLGDFQGDLKINILKLKWAMKYIKKIKYKKKTKIFYKVEIEVL